MTGTFNSAMTLITQRMSGTGRFSPASKETSGDSMTGATPANSSAEYTRSIPATTSSIGIRYSTLPTTPSTVRVRLQSIERPDVYREWTITVSRS